MTFQVIVEESGAVSIFDEGGHFVDHFDLSSPGCTMKRSMGDGYELEYWRDPDTRSFRMATNDPSGKRLQSIQAEKPGRYSIARADHSYTKSTERPRSIA